MSHRLSRRGFLRTTVAAAGVTVLTGAFRAGAYAANEKLNCACVGAGGRAGAHVDASGTQNLVALCDVDEGTLGAQAKRFPNAKTFTDYRKMFDEMAKDFDTVFVGTPDHHHAAASMLALKNHKNVYCEKPLTHSIYEARRLTEAAREAKVATQMGNQGNSSEETRRLVEYIKAGAIGKVTEVHIWTDRPINWWPQGFEKPAYADPVPGHLKWDLWLGPAPERPYIGSHHDGPFKGKPMYHPFVWRGWWDFGTGALGDIACHAMAPAFWALDLGKPTAVSAETSAVNAETFPAWSIITYEFPARGDQPPVKLVWYDGGKRPARPEELEQGRDVGDNGALYVGDKGKMFGNRIIPESKMKDFKRPDQTIPRVPGNNHHEDFFIACRGGRPASSNFDFAGNLAEAALVGNVAIRAGKKIEWDAANMKPKNCSDPAVLQVIRRVYRKGWTL
jgi:predicted dehydrogenase